MRTLLLLLLTAYAATAQKKTYTLADTPIRIDSATGGMIYTEVVRIDSVTQEQLYSRAKLFVTKAFTNEGVVTQVDDKTGGLVSARGKVAYTVSTGMMMLTGSPQLYYEMTCEIQVKDGRYRYEFSNMEILSRGIRVQVDQQMRKHPKWARDLQTKPISQGEYDKYMGDKNPVIPLIRKLKQTMNPPRSKSDF